MQLVITPETTEEALQLRALTARAMEQDKTLAELFTPWTIDQSSAAVNRAPLSAASVLDAEARAAAAKAERDRLAAEKPATAAPAEPIL
jgi:hypothetical protein